jgi:hypothetical protein
MTYRVTADIEYLDGALEGLLIPAGYRVTYPNYRLAMKCAAWLQKVERTNDFVRAAVTGNRYAVRGHVEVSKA